MPRTYKMRPLGIYRGSTWLADFLIMTVILLVLDSSVLAASPEDQEIQSLAQLSFEELLKLPIKSVSHFLETPLDVASTVTVIPRSSWEERGARRLSDAFAHLPAIMSMPNFVGSYATRIRGFAQADARGVVTLWDGVSINSYNLATADLNRPNIQLATLDSIEVIRGPGSVHYGTDAFHGVISLNAFESETDVNRISARAASNGFYSASYTGSTAIGAGWRLNASIATGGQPDQDFAYQFTDPGTGGPASSDRAYEYRSNTAVLKLVSDQDRALSYRFGLYYDGIDQDEFHGQGGQGFLPQNDVGSVDSKIAMATLTATYSLSADSSISLHANRWDQTHFFELPVTAARNLEVDADEYHSEVKFVYRNEALSAGTQFSAESGIRVDDVRNARRRIFDTMTTFVDSAEPFSGQDRSVRFLALAGRTDLEDQQWILHYGFRLDDYDGFGAQFTPRFGVVRKVNETSAVKLLYGNAFRAPSAVEVSGNAFIAGNPNLEPETLDSIELVFLRQTENSRFEAVAFVSKWRDAISATDIDNDGSDDMYVNLSENDSYGIEITYHLRQKNLLVETSGSYVRSKSDTPDTGFDAFAEYIVNLGIGYEFANDWVLYVNNRAHLHADAGPKRRTIEPAALKDYWRTDVNLAKRLKGGWNAFANVRNIFNRENFLPSLVNTEGGVQDEEFSIDIGLSSSF